MQSQIISASLDGMEARAVVIETDISRGLPKIEIIGLGDQAIKEAAARVRSAIANEGMDFPGSRITINLSPAWLRKRGSHFDLAFAIGVMASSGQIFDDKLKEFGFIGELGLDGGINRCKGTIQLVRAIKDYGIRRMIVPIGNIEEAMLVEGVEIYGARRLRDVVDYFNLRNPDGIILADSSSNMELNEPGEIPDFIDVKGQEHAKRAALIAAAGGHGLLMRGSPGTGKTMIAERIPYILPDLSNEEILDLTAVYSVAGLLNDDRKVVLTRPFRNPGMSISVPALLGSGSPPRPGEISLAHKGILFLDELGERGREVIDALRMPLETREIVIQRMGVIYRYPGDFMFVSATNPCKCGYYGDPRKECTCTQGELQAYRSKISGPILGRIDILVELLSPEYDEYIQGEGMSTEFMRGKVLMARDIQKKRFGTGSKLNSDMDGEELDASLRLSEDAEAFIKAAYGRLGMEPRSLVKVKRISRTIADLEGSEDVGIGHLSEAIQYRERLVRR